jgi:hypothetical protein
MNFKPFGLVVLSHGLACTERERERAHKAAPVGLPSLAVLSMETQMQRVMIKIRRKPPTMSVQQSAGRARAQ